MKILNAFFILLVCVVFFTSCHNPSEFTITGKIDGIQENDTLFLYLEKRDFNKIKTLDSIKVNKDGNFSIKGLSPEYPDLYVLRLGEQSINLSVDSIETIVVNTSKTGFATDYKIEGSDNTVRMKEVIQRKTDLQKKISDLKNQYWNKEISVAEYQTKLEEQVNEYKTAIKKIIISDLKSPTAYFALFQKIDDTLIFNPYQKDDSRMYSAVATAWDTYHKETPRAQYLREFTIKAIKERKSLEEKSGLVENLKVVDGFQYFNIVLPNVNDDMVPLESLKGKVVLLDFTAYQAEYSPLHNANLNDAYKGNHDNFEIYQVSFDPDTHFWKNAALNLPWVCVRDNEMMDSYLVKRFNIQQLPTMYLFNRQGELVKRLEVGVDIGAEVRKLF